MDDKIINKILFTNESFEVKLEDTEMKAKRD